MRNPIFWLLWEAHEENKNGWDELSNSRQLLDERNATIFTETVQTVKIRIAVPPLKQELTAYKIVILQDLTLLVQT